MINILTIVCLLALGACIAVGLIVGMANIIAALENDTW